MTSVQDRAGAPQVAVSSLPIRAPLPARARGLLAQVRGMVRTSEVLLVMVAGVVGCIAGALVTFMSDLSQAAHIALFHIALDQRLSATAKVPLASALLVPLGGGLLIGLSELWRNWRKARTPIDPVEANALRGGRMSLRDSVLVALQTVVSNGSGGSVGLEAGYTQIGSGIASRLGIMLNLRRADLRIMVGAGAAGAIAAAFAAPLTGAFYAFELIVGVYSVSNVAAIMTAALTAVLTGAALSGGAAPYSLHVASVQPLHTIHYLAIVMLGLCSAFLGVAVMRTVAVVERVFAATRLPPFARPALGGLILGGLALVTPQVLGAGHGALKLDWPMDLSMRTLAMLIALKLTASMVSLGSGFRGGLFFASLFVGSLVGKLYGVALERLMPGFGLDVTACMLAGMGTVAVSIVGGPLTMSFLVLETTGDFTLTGAVLAACVAASLTVREVFGYSFSTWRLHLRGETIRSATDVGWVRSLTVGRLMRKDVATIDDRATIADFRRRYPLGSRQFVVVLDQESRYRGLLATPTAFAAELDETAARTRIGDLARLKETALLPEMNVKEAMDTFGKAEAETLAVVDGPDTKLVVGLLNEAYATRRYAEALNNASRDVVGEV